VHDAVVEGGAREEPSWRKCMWEESSAFALQTFSDIIRNSLQPHPPELSKLRHVQTTGTQEVTGGHGKAEVGGARDAIGVCTLPTHAHARRRLSCGDRQHVADAAVGGNRVDARWRGRTCQVRRMGNRRDTGKKRLMSEKATVAKADAGDELRAGDVELRMHARQRARGLVLQKQHHDQALGLPDLRVRQRRS
jgi:hypothetical protein